MERAVRQQVDSEIFPPGYVKKILYSLGIGYKNETEHQLNLLCLFHSDNSPSFTINTRTGKYFCFVASCGAVGDLIDLVKRYKNLNDFEALRFMARNKSDSSEAFEATLKDLLRDEEEFDQFDIKTLQRLSDQFSERAIQYMAGRGITEQTCRHFGVGYSKKNDMVTIPIYNHTGVPVAIIGRGLETKRFQYSKHAPISKVWFNLNRAKKLSRTAIIVESSMDVLKIHQVGFPNAIALLGGQVSEYKMNILNRYFDKVILMSDNDEIKFYEKCRAKQCKRNKACIGHNPGRETGQKIADGFVREVWWAITDANTIYPHGAKDAGELTENEIRIMIENAVPDYEFADLF